MRLAQDSVTCYVSSEKRPVDTMSRTANVAGYGLLRTGATKKVKRGRSDDKKEPFEKHTVFFVGGLSKRVVFGRRCTG